MHSIIEYVFGASLLNVYISKFNVVVKVQIASIFTPQNNKALSDEAKLFVEKKLLHRVVGSEIIGVENNGNFAVRVHHPGGDIA